MRFLTRDEFEHFIFKEIHISEVSFGTSSFKAILDDVVILPENSCNRDIRNMRCNAMQLTISDARIVSFMKEGYKIYDADGNLRNANEDTPVAEADYKSVFESFADTTAYEITKENNRYSFVIDVVTEDADEMTYNLVIEGSCDTEEWDRFLNLEPSL